ncbi:hypothetical protein H5410_061730 [Solanum commersonii]|uniref:Uncharacterized protein n=1 Tax=Solanum commersonii TaxID=4109 RepID=A0A9J5W9N6_SOLCO|nr:hypothetical protein H5410_061730 [Solanum commersonii]
MPKVKGIDQSLKVLLDIHLCWCYWKGRGQGLKSLVREETCQLRVLCLNLVIWLMSTCKKLKQGQGQGLTNSTLFTSQGMITIPKNSIDLEKENKQINPSAHASTNLGKGRGQGLKSSTLCISQGMGMKYNNYMTSESELGCINKSALYANQHIKTPSISTRANLTMSSSQEMQRMDKSILEKEDMQTNLSLPPSIDQVMEHSQTTEKVKELHLTKIHVPIFVAQI